MKETLQQGSFFDPTDPIGEIALAFQKSRVFLTACQLDVFSVLEGEPKTSQDVSVAIGSNPKGTDRLLNALCALGLLEKNAGRFSTTHLTSKFLVRGKPDYMSGFLHLINMRENWRWLIPTLKRGRPAVSFSFRENVKKWLYHIYYQLHETLKKGILPKRRRETWLRNYIAWRHNLALKCAPAVVELVDLSGVDRMLDIEGGPGTYAGAFVRAKRDLKITVFDPPFIIPLTRDYISRQEFSDGINVVSGDFNKDDPGMSFDLVFMSILIHGNSVAQNKALFQKAYNALSPGGQLVIHDFIIDEDRTGPAFHALFALHMLLVTPAGDTYTDSEVRTWMQEAGFSNIHRQNVSVGTTLIIGSRAA